MSYFSEQIQFLTAHSSYAMRWLNARSDWVQWLEVHGGQTVDQDGIWALLGESGVLGSGKERDEERFMSDLRLARQKFMLWLAFRDLNGLASLDEVMRGMSQFAQSAVALCIDFIREDLKRRFGVPWSVAHNSEMPLMVVGMGKLGGYELNLSSDIDLIFLYECDGQTQSGPQSLSHQEWFTRMGKRLIKLLAEHRDNGFVFRVDMRLRPNGDAGPLVCSLPMLEEYLMVQGREWERYAWIKGRLIAPAPHSAQFADCEKELDQLIRPFVYRRHLDYGVIASIRDLHAQIQIEAEKRSSNHHGRSQDIKLGRGGIREIEFLAQMFQLMRGGTDPRFRVRPTLEVLDLIAERALLPRNAIDSLKAAYVFLRRLEHRIQVWEDQQTHYLPEDELARARLASAMLGPIASRLSPTLIQELEMHQAAVAAQFEEAFVLEDKARLELAPLLANWRPDPHFFPEGFKRWELWLASPKLKQLPEKSRLIIFNLLSKATEYLQENEVDLRVADTTLLRLFDLLESISRRNAYLAILAEYPKALLNVLALLKASQWGAAYLAGHPYLLDYLLNSRTELLLVDQPGQYWREVKSNLAMRLDDAQKNGEDAEQSMDILRVTHHTETFITLLADLGIGMEQGLPVEKVSDHLSALADLILQATFEHVWPSVAQKFNLNPVLPPFAVISYGKLGGKELGYASDLDLVFLYQSESPGYADQEIYALLAKRMINWLTAYTAAGSLFEIDTRLRPNGSAGFLVTDADAFRKYQLREGDNAAWVWEHQALTRARCSAGSPVVGEYFERVRSEVLRQKRNQETLRTEILDMRTKVHAGHPNPTAQFDLKHDAGGMVDIEFIVQFLVLAHARSHEQLVGNLGNIALLNIAGNVGLIEKTLAEKVGDAYRLLRARQHRLRLDGVEKVRIDLDAEPALVQARAWVMQLWQDIFKASINE
jgi:[glutamine synthetase] adenylyltransferase / [glutamine synthetase]-adenylyl-L-tyrosine phosphorylase